MLENNINKFVGNITSTCVLLLPLISTPCFVKLCPFIDSANQIAAAMCIKKNLYYRKGAFDCFSYNLLNWHLSKNNFQDLSS